MRPAAWVELISLSILLINMYTAHIDAITSMCGPVHGCAYLIVLILALNRTTLPVRTRLLGLIPGVGGVLVLRQTS
ncbi:DUF3817 domain-containing protein [Actinoplanes sichuanensis]|uniref:DUF3817 domain-containing protein n=1 Tax=Actinoplanes sichuanensis TaxID=512349 RepID=UPI0037BE4A6C